MPQVLPQFIMAKERERPPVELAFRAAKAPLNADLLALTNLRKISNSSIVYQGS